jgi:E3 SUMO-protein ligase PIAS1
MVFCAAEGHGRQDIAFPHQSEIKVNGGEVKANLRGLKNKPGSTRPVDITKELRLNLPTYSNTVEMTYALTSKVGGGSQVSCLNSQSSFPLFPNCFSPLRRSA